MDDFGTPLREDHLIMRQSELRRSGMFIDAVLSSRNKLLHYRFYKHSVPTGLSFSTLVQARLQSVVNNNCRIMLSGIP